MLAYRLGTPAGLEFRKGGVESAVEISLLEMQVALA